LNYDVEKILPNIIAIFNLVELFFGRSNMINSASL
jgi:hypothetical protein